MMSKNMFKRLICPYHKVGNDSAINAGVILLDGSRKQWSLSLTSDYNPVKRKTSECLHNLTILNISLWLMF